jgi:Carboxypeptidase regulatory-like domain
MNWISRQQSKRCGAMLLGAFALFACIPAYPQATATASLGGTAVDESGATIPRAKVSLVSKETQAQRDVIASETGTFSLPALPPGIYTLQVKADGFQSTEVQNLVLRVGDQISVTVKMRIGTQESSVNVEAESVLVRESPAVATVVDHQFIENEPLNGRSFQTLIGLTPGIVFTPSNVVTQGQFSANGQRANTNYFTVDGVSANFGSTLSQVLYETASGSIPSFSTLGGTNTLASIDAVEEFAVQTSSVAPEFGRTPGAQVSIVSRSGTNTLHGTTFNYLRNDVFDANDWFANANGVPNPALRQNDFGGVLGGPVVIPGTYNGRNKTFFFFSYEGLRLRQPTVTAPEEVPSIAARQAATGTIKQILNAFPVPNRPAPDGEPNSGGFVGSFSNPASLDATSIRLDHKISDRLTLFGRYNHAPSDLFARALFSSANTISNTLALTETTTVGATAILAPHVVNDTRFNFSRSKSFLTYTFDGFGGTVVPPDSLLLPPFASRENDEGYISIGSNGGIGVGPNSLNRHRQINLTDSLSVTVGSHGLKFGVDYRRNLSINKLPVNYRFLIFDDVSQVLTGNVGLVYAGNDGPTLFPVYKNFSAYAQDVWRFSPRLTVTYGLRWDVNPAPTEKNGRDLLTIKNLNPDRPETAKLAPKGTPLYDTTFGNFAPRIGIAYKLRRDHGTVVRGGFGVFYDLGSTFSGSAYNPTGALIAANLPLSSPDLSTPIPFPSPDSITLETPGARFVAYQAGFKLPYTLQYNLAIEHPFGGANVVTATYVGAVGRRLERLEQLPDLNGLDFISNSATSDYNGLQLQYRRRLSRGLQVLASYAWAHSIDIVSDVSIINVQAPLTRYKAALDRGSSNFDIRHSFNAAVSFLLPEPRVNRALNAALHGWALDAIVTARSAPPVNITTNQDLLNVGLTNVSRPDLVPGKPLYISDSSVAGGRKFNPDAFSIPETERQGTLGRNVLRGFNASQLDVSVRRAFHLAEQLQLEAKLDAFNVLNHPNFASPSGVLDDPNFGTSTQMLGRALGGLNPLYQVGGPRSLQLGLKLKF